MPRAGALLRLPNSGTAEPVAVGDARQQASTTGDSFESKWAGTKRRRRAKVRDPYEQVYWLIAVASIMVGIASTLTLVQAPPEFDPQHLNVKWQDKMMRRLWDFDEGPPDQTAPQPPRRNP